MKNVLKVCMLIAAALSVFIGCGQNNPLSSLSDNSADVAIALPGGAQAQTITAEASAVVSGEVVLTKVATGETLTKTGPAGATIRFNKILPGAYTVTVKLFDAAGEILYEGTASVAAVSGATVPVNVTVTSKGGSISVGVIIDDTDPTLADLLFWNKLDSSAGLSSSEVGGAVTGSNIQFVAGKFGQAIKVSTGVGPSFLRIPLWAAGSKKWGTDELTFEFWFSTDCASPGSDLALLWEFVEGSGPAGASHSMRVATWNNPTTIAVGTILGQDFATYAWDNAVHHMAVVISKTDLKYYIDGILIDTVPFPASYPGTAMPHVVHFGSEYQQDGDFQWTGIVDNVKVYSGAKTNFSDRNIE